MSNRFLKRTILMQGDSLNIEAGRVDYVAGDPWASRIFLEEELEGELVVYGLENIPEWMSYDAERLVLYGTPPRGTTETFTWQLEFADSANASSKVKVVFIAAPSVYLVDDHSRKDLVSGESINGIESSVVSIVGNSTRVDTVAQWDGKSRFIEDGSHLEIDLLGKSWLENTTGTLVIRTQGELVNVECGGFNFFVSGSPSSGFIIESSLNKLFNEVAYVDDFSDGMVLTIQYNKDRNMVEAYLNDTYQGNWNAVLTGSPIIKVRPAGSSGFTLDELYMTNTVKYEHHRIARGMWFIEPTFNEHVIPVDLSGFPNIKAGRSFSWLMPFVEEHWMRNVRITGLTGVDFLQWRGMEIYGEVSYLNQGEFDLTVYMEDDVGHKGVETKRVRVVVDETELKLVLSMGSGEYASNNWIYPPYADRPVIIYALAPAGETHWELDGGWGQISLRKINNYGAVIEGIVYNPRLNEYPLRVSCFDGVKTEEVFSVVKIRDNLIITTPPYPVSLDDTVNLEHYPEPPELRALVQDVSEPSMGADLSQLEVTEGYLRDILQWLNENYDKQGEVSITALTRLSAIDGFLRNQLIQYGLVNDPDIDTFDIEKFDIVDGSVLLKKIRVEYNTMIPEETYISRFNLEPGSVRFRNWTNALEGDLVAGFELRATVLPPIPFILRIEGTDYGAVREQSFVSSYTVFDESGDTFLSPFKWDYVDTPPHPGIFVTTVDDENMLIRGALVDTVDKVSPTIRVESSGGMKITRLLDIELGDMLSLLRLTNGTQFTDSVEENSVIVHGTPLINSDRTHFGGGSFSASLDNSYLEVILDEPLGDSDWDISFWLYVSTQVTVGNSVIRPFGFMENDVSEITIFSNEKYNELDGTGLYAAIMKEDGSIVNIHMGAHDYDKFNLVKIYRRGDTIYAGVGDSKGSMKNERNFTQTHYYVGGLPNGLNNVKHFNIDEVRLVKGVGNVGNSVASDWPVRSDLPIAFSEFPAIFAGESFSMDFNPEGYIVPPITWSSLTLPDGIEIVGQGLYGAVQKEGGTQLDFSVIVKDDIARQSVKTFSGKVNEYLCYMTFEQDALRDRTGRDWSLTGTAELDFDTSTAELASLYLNNGTMESTDVMNFGNEGFLVHFYTKKHAGINSNLIDFIDSNAFNGQFRISILNDVEEGISVEYYKNGNLEEHKELLSLPSDWFRVRLYRFGNTLFLQVGDEEEVVVENAFNSSFSTNRVQLGEEFTKTYFDNLRVVTYASRATLTMPEVSDYPLGGRAIPMPAASLNEQYNHKLRLRGVRAEITSAYILDGELPNGLVVSSDGYLMGVADDDIGYYEITLEVITAGNNRFRDTFEISVAEYVTYLEIEDEEEV